MADAPLTVLIAVYNGERYVGETIESILSQSYGDYELLIIDDGSNDSTPKILQQYATRDPRIRLLQQDNHGVGYTLNRGLAEARGALVAQIGADDVALPGRLKKQVDFLDQNPEYVLLGGYLRIIDRDGRPLGMRQYPLSDEQLRKRIVLYNPFGAPSVMFRRDDALAAGGFTSRFWTCEDYDFVFRIAKRGKVANLPEPLTAYRLHDESVKSRDTVRQLRDTIDAKRAAFAEYGYRQPPSARLVNAAQELMTRLPAGAVYWLFSKLFIRTG